MSDGFLPVSLDPDTSVLTVLCVSHPSLGITGHGWSQLQWRIHWLQEESGTGDESTLRVDQLSFLLKSVYHRPLPERPGLWLEVAQHLGW